MIGLMDVWKGNDRLVDSYMSRDRCCSPFSIAVQKSAGSRRICMSFLIFGHEASRW
jgi:hypothetical protein